MKKTILRLAPIIVLAVVFLFSAYNASTGKDKLFCNKYGNFTILIVSDPQCDNKKQWLEAKNELETLINRSNPDFIIINGDMNSQNQIPDEMWNLFISPIKSRGLFWSTTNGNHDPYTNKNYMLFKSSKNCLNSRVSPADQNYEASRPINYVIPIYSNDGKRVVFAVYGMDSGGVNQYGYEGLTEKQISWYAEQSEKLKNQNDGVAVTSLMCIHIPITQTLDMFYSNKNSNIATPKQAGGLYKVYGVTNQGEQAITNYICENKTEVPQTFLHTTAVQNDRGIFKKILKQQDVKIMVFGHEHKTNIAGSYKGVLLSFAGKLSTGCYSDTLCRGGRVIKFNQNNPQDFTTQWLGSIPSSLDQPAIYSDGTLAK